MSFSVEKAVDKLKKLDLTQQSIQSTSQWCLFHYRHHKEIVAIWLKNLEEISNTKPERSLVSFYLCNDLIQFSKKNERKFRGFLEEYVKILPKSVKLMRLCVDKEAAGDAAVDAGLTKKYMHVLKVWEDRNMFDRRFITKLMQVLNKGKRVANAAAHEEKSRALASIVSEASGGEKYGIQAAIPDDLKAVVKKYWQLELLTGKSLDEFTRISTGYNQLVKNSQNLPEPSEFVLKLGKLEQLSSLVVNSIEKVTKSRDSIIAELRKLIGIQEDWKQLDSGKIKKLHTMNSDILGRKKEIQKLVDASVSNASRDEAANGEDISPNYESAVQDGGLKDGATDTKKNGLEGIVKNDDDDDLPTYSLGAETAEKDDDDDDDDDNSNKEAAQGKEPSPLRSSLKRDAGENGNAQPTKRVKFAAPEPEQASELKDGFDDDDKDGASGASGDAPAGGDLLSILNQLT